MSRPTGKHARRPAPGRKRTTARKLVAIPALAVPALGGLAIPALAAESHLSAPADQCQAWQPVIPGLLSVGTAPLLTIGPLHLFGNGTCLPYGRNNDLEIGASIAIPPGSLCGQPPLLRVSLGLAVGPTDPDGSDPCQAAATAPISPTELAPLMQPSQPETPLPIRSPLPPRPVRQIPPPIRPTPPPATTPTKPAVAPPASSAPPLAIALPPPVHAPTPPAPPTAANPPAPANIPPPAVPPAAVGPAAPARHAAPGKPALHPAAPVPAPARAMPFPRAEAQQQSSAMFTPGKPVMPIGVLITVVMTPCVATAAARLGRVLAGRA